MAILEVGSIGGRSGQISETGAATYVLRWYVDTDTPHHGAKSIIDAVGVKRGDIYQVGTFTETEDPVTHVPIFTPDQPWAEREPLCYCLGISAEQTDPLAGDEDGCRWIVTATYQPYSADIAGIENPLDEPPSLSYDTVSYERPLDEAYDEAGDLTVAVLNAAFDPFDPPVVRDDSRQVFQVSVNWPDFDRDLARQYADAVNSDEFFGYPIGTVKMKPPKAAKVYHQGVPGGFYWRVDFEFEVRDEGWVKRVLNCGMRQLNSAGDGYESILNEDGQPISEPALLDADGRHIADPTLGDPIFLEFTGYKTLPFVTALGFGGP